MQNRRYQLYMCIILVVCFLVIFVLVGLQAHAAPVYTQTNTHSILQARTADRFIDTIGVNTHLHYTDTVYGQSFDEIIKPKLLASGIRHVRDGAYTSDDHRRDHFYYQRVRALAAEGIRFNLITSMDTEWGTATDYTKLEDVYAWTDGAVESFEGINEPDLQDVDNWVPIVRKAQKQLYTTVKDSPDMQHIKVFGPSPVWATKELGDLSAYLDYGNVHPYPGGKMPTGKEYGQSTETIIADAQVNSGDKPVMLTETGYHNALETEDDHLPTSEQATAKYLLRMFFEHFNRNIPRTYIYEFINTFADSTTNREASFGLLRNDGSEKPAYKAIKNMITILEDTDGSFDPDTLDLSISGGDDSIHHTLLQKADGTFYLALWQEKPSWDRHERKEISVPSQDVTLTFTTAIEQARLYTPLTSAEAVEEHTQPDKLTLSVPDHPVIIALQPAQIQQKPAYNVALPLVVSAR
ncbi:MAG: hypothetical protein AAGF95_03815 [Chloroflexota bacterium]